MKTVKIITYFGYFEKPDYNFLRKNVEIRYSFLFGV